MTALEKMFTTKSVNPQAAFFYAKMLDSILNKKVPLRIKMEKR
jgi:hypothetical protein